MQNSDDSIKDLLAKIRERPLVIGRPSIQNLRAVLDGFMWARRTSHPEERKWMSAFGTWLAFRFEVFSTVGWWQIIPLFTSCEAEELPLFWKCLDAFEESEGKLPGIDDDAEFTSQQLAVHIVDRLVDHRFVDKFRIEEAVASVKWEREAQHKLGAIVLRSENEPSA